MFRARVAQDQGLVTEMDEGYWRCPLCGERDGEHLVACPITEDSDLEWVEDDDDY